jgi:hypothetical protein
MQVETKFLRLYQPVALGEQIDGWRVCWLGGWGKNQLFYYVMVERGQESTLGSEGRTR